MTELRAIHLSPHLDDAVLSSGGRIRAEAKRGRVLVVTLFAGEPGAVAGDPSPAIDRLHRAWRLGERPVGRRRAEDERACALLGAEARHEELPEALYRRHPESGRFLYPEVEELFGPLVPADEPLAAAVRERIARLPRARRLYAPLGLGGHVDHRLVRRAVEELAGTGGSEIVWYEEYPYAEEAEAVEEALPPGEWRPEVFPLDRAAAAAKRRAVRAYRSQVRPLFGGRLRLARRLRRHHRRAGGERAWVAS